MSTDQFTDQVTCQVAIGHHVAPGVQRGWTK